MKALTACCVVGCWLASPLALADAAQLQTQTLSGGVPLQSWKQLRDTRVVKQDKDYSCGAASIATVLTEYYRRPTTEEEVLDLLVNLGTGCRWQFLRHAHFFACADGSIDVTPSLKINTP